MYFYHPDHLGSSSYITDREGRITQHTEYIAFGEVLFEEHSTSRTMPYLFNGKELDTETGLYYYGARYYDAKTSIFLNVDPLAEKYPHTSPYTYVNNNPIMLVDPDGRDIIGVTRKDAQNFQQDIYRVLKDKKFEGVRALISIKGSKFNKIDVSALTKALENISVNTDEKAYIDMVANTINSKEIHKVEYLSGDFTSAEGATAFRDHMNKAQEGIGDMLLTPDGNFSSTFIDSQGGGLNVPTKDGSHSFISAIHKDDDRAITSGHELFGHGIPSAKKMNDKTNNSNAIRTDNLIRRLLGKPERDGSDHAGYNQGHIIEPNELPMTK